MPLLALILSFVLPVSATAPAVRVATIQATPPPPTLPAAPEGVPCGEWFPTALEAGWSAAEWPTVGAIMERESQCTPSAVNHNANGTVDRGLMQVNSVHRGWLADVGITLAMLLDPWNNLRAARLLYERSGWAPWRVVT